MLHIIAIKMFCKLVLKNPRPCVYLLDSEKMSYFDRLQIAVPSVLDKGKKDSCSKEFA